MLFRKKIISAFIHIPKTGGTYLTQRESDRIPVISQTKPLGHTCIISSKSNKLGIYPPPVGFLPDYITPYSSVKKYFLFSTVRNIYDWLVSYYYHAGGFNPKYNNPNHYDYNNARKGFDYLVQTIADRDKNIWPNRQLIHFQLFSDAGEMVVNWLNRTKTLDDDLEQLAKHLGVNYNRKPRQRIGKQCDYRSLYTDTLIDLVSTTWAREMRLFGFKFDSSSFDKSYLKNLLTPDVRNSVKYYWSDDRLLVNNQEW